MGREQDLERQMQELKKAKQLLIDKTGDCLRFPDNVKAKMWDAVVPHIKGAVESKLKDSVWPESAEFRNVIYDKVMTAVLGDGWADLLAKV